jgi:distribution and morphology protein 12
MSIDINWESLTAGPEGEELEKTVHQFIDDKFQRIALPRFIRSVQVHSIKLGSVAPEAELKDICDPLPDFYEDPDDSDEEDEKATSRELQSKLSNKDPSESSFGARLAENEKRRNGPLSRPPSYIDTRFPGVHSFLEQLATPGPNVHTPGIPGGTSNLNSFHSPLANGLSGTQTPLAAVAGAHLPRGWPENMAKRRDKNAGTPNDMSSPSISSPSRPPTSESHVESNSGYFSKAHHTEDDTRAQDPQEDRSSAHYQEYRPEDVQVVMRVKYSGDVKLSLTAEILLDYPMPSFVGIPLRLNITGLSFDGIALLAHIRKRAHFCFLSPEDAVTLVGSEEQDETKASHGSNQMGGLLHEIRVESEIGQNESGKQVLKNVGKVEKFVLEQVRRIFEDELVYPSFWTFLI